MNMITPPADLRVTQGSSSVKELIVIDSAAPDKHLFYAQQSADVAIVEIPAGSDGLAELDRILGDYSGLESLHVVSHGEAGAIQLGDTLVDAAALQANGGLLANLDAAMVDGGDVFLYGCEVGGDGSGQELLTIISEGANVDVAASDDLTGAAHLGGDGELEITVGDVDAEAAIAPSVFASMSSLLPIPGTIAFATASNAGSGGGDGSVNATYTNGGYTLVVDGAVRNTRIYADPTNGYAYSSSGETSVTFSFSGGYQFDISSLSILNFLAPQTFTFTSNAGGNYTSGSVPSNGTQSIDLATAGGFTGITSFTVTGSIGAYAHFDDLVVSSLGIPNSEPVFTGLGGTVVYNEGVPVLLDADATVSDTELDALSTAGDYNGATLTVERNGGANTDDSFSFSESGPLFTVSGGNLQSGGLTFATFTNSGGTLTVNFTSSGTTATSALVDQVVQRILYSNTNPSPFGSAVLDYTFNDGTDDSIGTNQVSVTLNNGTSASTTAAGANTNTGANLSPGIIFDTANETLTVANASHGSGSTFNGQAGSDTLVLVTGVDLSGATVSNFENLTLASGGTFTFGASQLGIFSGTITAAGSETINVVGDGNFTTLANVEDFSVGDDSTNTRTITVAEAGTNVSATSGTDAVTFDVGTLAFTGTLIGDGTVNDTVLLGNGANITGATLTNIENLTIASGATVSMTVAQLNSFTGGVTATGTQQVNLSGDGDFTTVADIESFSVGDDSTNTRTITVDQISVNVSATSATDAITFAIGSITYGGTLTGEGTVNDVLSLADGAFVSSATLNNIEDLTLATGATVTLNAAQLAGFTGTITAAGSEQINVNADGDFTTLANVEVYSVADDTTNTRTITVASANASVSATTGNDAINFDIGTLTFTGTLVGNGTVNDTVTLGNGASITGATLTNIENVTLTNGATVSMTAAQLASFTGTVTANVGPQFVNVSGDGDFTTLADVEEFSVGDDSTNTRTITINGSDTDVTAFAANDAVTFSLGTGAFTGRLIGNGFTNDTLSVVNGTDVSGATLSNIENLTIASGASVSMTVAQLNAFTGTITATGTNAINLTNSGTITNTNLGAIETLSTTSGGTEIIQASASIVNNKTLTAADTGSDAFNITGAAGNQVINGSAGSDTLFGGAGTDTIYGGAGADTINGNNQADLIAPGSGADVMTGGFDNDTFTGSDSDLNGDTIADLEAGDTVILTGFALGSSEVSFNGSNDVLRIDTDGNTGNGFEVQINLSNTPGASLDIGVSNDGSDTTIDFTTANFPPVLAGVDGTPSYIEGAAAVLLDTDATVSDTELDALNTGVGNYDGASFTVARNGGADGDDVFSFVTGGNLTVSSGNIQAGGNTIATFTSTTGTLTVTFTNTGTIPTSALADEVLQAVRYQNTSDNQPANVTLDYTFNDGTAPSTGTNQVVVSLTDVNDEPTLIATGGNPTFTEDGGAQDLFNTVTASTVETGQNFTSITLTVTNVNDGANEILSFDGSNVALTNGNSVTTATNSLTANVSVAGTTATVQVTGASLSSAQMGTLIDTLTYQNTSDDPTTLGNRVVTITELIDDGGTANSGDATAAPNTVSTVTVVGVNDPPVIGGVFGDTSSQVVAGTGPGNLVGLDDATVSNPDSDDHNGGFLTIAQTSGTTNGSWGADGTTVTSGGDATISAGEVISVSSVAIGTVNVTDDGQGGNDLTINFNTAGADDVAIQALIRNLTFDAPSVIDTRAFDLTLNDNDGVVGGGDQDVTGSFSLSVTPNPPVIAGLDGDSLTLANGGTANVDVGGNAAVTDADSADFNTGTLTIARQGGLAGDFGLDGTSVTVSPGFSAGATLSVSGTAIGTLVASNTGQGTEDLQVTLNANATPARLSTVLQELTYTSTAPGAQGFDVTIADGTGATSLTSSFTINVNALPVNTVPGAQAAVDGTALAIPGISVADADGGTVTTTVSVTSGDGTFSTTGAATITGDNTNSIQLVGSVADVNTTLGNLVYTPAVDAAFAQTVTVLTNDGTDTDSDTFTVNVTDRPTLINLDGGSISSNVGVLTQFDADVAVGDTDTNDFTGGTLNIARTGTISGDFSLDGTTATSGTTVGTADAVITLGDTIFVGGLAIATVTADGQGTNALTLALNTVAATRATQTAFLQNLQFTGDVASAGGFDVTITDPTGNTSEVASVTATVTVPSSGGGASPESVVTSGSDFVDLSQLPNVPISLEGGNDTAGDSIFADLVYGNQGQDSLEGANGQDTLYGGQDDDFVGGGADNDLLFGNRGDDLVNGGPGDDAVYGNEGQDTVIAGTGNDVAFGGQGNDIVYGNQGEDQLFGNRGADLLFGGQGNDQVSGGEGADTLVGGVGDDTLTGGPGADSFDFGTNSGASVITDYDGGTGDVIIGNGFDAADTVTLTNEGLLIQNEAGATLLLIGVTSINDVVFG
ncbi:MAG: DUF4347 domain-containing protein [Alphaproteobacteria bacterium]|nr:DUF4347 domain-containing protein [Alphaproteobacteria bacterium SS10]